MAAESRLAAATAEEEARLDAEKKAEAEARRPRAEILPVGPDFATYFKRMSL